VGNQKKDPKKSIQQQASNFLDLFGVVVEKKKKKKKSKKKKNKNQSKSCTHEHMASFFHTSVNKRLERSSSELERRFL
jgi:hypothetical protein